MKNYWYIETIFESPYQRMVVSQEVGVDTPHILIYEDHPDNPHEMWMAHHPLFNVEYVFDKSGWQKMESLVIYLPDNVATECVDIYYDDGLDNPYPPGFQPF